MLASLALGASGCGEDVQQQRARETAEAFARSGTTFVAEEAQCSRAARRGFFVEQETHLFVCAVHRRDGDCAWLDVTVRQGGDDVSVRRTRADCVLPF